jgi:hypothetical protein
MAGESLERPVVVAALLALFVVLAVESAGVIAAFWGTPAPQPTTRSLFNYAMERTR